MKCNRLTAAGRMLRSPERVYSMVSYCLGALISARNSGPGPVAWVRGFPAPAVRAGDDGVRIGHVGLYPGAVVFCAEQATVTIGDHTYINRNSRVWSTKEITVGHHCMISWDVVITDLYADDDLENSSPASPERSEPVVIGDNVWICARCVILGGTRIGAGSIVAAGTVVQGVFPPGSIIAGASAEVSAT